MRLSLSRAIRPLAIEFLLARNDVHVDNVLDEVIHMSLLRSLAVFPEAASDLHVVG